MKRQNFIRHIAKSTQEEYGPEFTDFELDAVLMTLENFGFDVNTLFNLSDGESEDYICTHWDDEEYLSQDPDYCVPNGFEGLQGGDVTRIVLDDNNKVAGSERVKHGDLPDDVKSRLPR